MRNLQDIPIRQKLMLITILITTAALLISGAGVVVSDSVLLRSYLQRDLVSLSRIIADNSTAALAFDDPLAAAEMLSTLRARPHLEYACIYRMNGTILASYRRPGNPPECPSADPRDSARMTSESLTVSHPVILNNRPVGSLVLRYDLGEIYERMLLYGGTVLVVLIASGLIALVLSARLWTVFATPILQLASTATEVSRKSDYTLRARRFSGDEFGILVDRFNEMLARIQTRDEELRKAFDAREEVLREVQSVRDFLRTTLESIADAVISTDVEGRVVFTNRVAQALVKLPDTELAGKPLDQVVRIVNEQTRENVENPVRQVLRDGNVSDLRGNTVLIASDGTETPIDESGAPIRSGQSGPVQGTVLVFRDVSIRRRADETSRLLASIVQSSSDAIIGEDLEGRITSWNEGAVRILGYTAEEMIGHPISEIAPPDRQHEMDEILGRIRNGERIEHFPTVRRTKSGSLINVSISCSPLYDALGQISGVSKIARDTTEQMKAAQRLEQLNTDLKKSNERLASSNEDLERFAFVASHDLQEPLRMITAYSQLLIESVNGPPDAQRSMFVDHIVNGTRRMRELLADLLAYAEIGAGPEQPIGSVDLNDVIAIVMRNLEVVITDSKVAIYLDKLPSLHGYQGHFISLFQNLIENAIKYRSDRPPEIRVTFEETPAELRFAVTDNGIGIAPEYFEKIFSAFKRLHGKMIPGTGIGLAICQRVVQRYGGRIWVESEVGKGASFRFALPVQEGSREGVINGSEHRADRGQSG